jgi:hypothetical protein
MATRRPEDPGLGLGLSMEPVKVELGGLEPPTPACKATYPSAVTALTRFAGCP